ncbi:MAG TPA: CDF family Co(II)/Ni(II) efflux transporter DmeF [Rhodocyclaceae bacterium]|jgi:cation diffusion facilitator family transporter
MTNHDHSLWNHEHIFSADTTAAERSTRLVMIITLAMMVVEIAAGWWYNSMALLADGWHMSSHAVAIGLSAFAYAASRRYARDRRFAFGTWKIEVLAGFVSALFLLLVAAGMIWGSVERLITPQPIHYLEAIVVAVIGLLVNLACALILNGGHHHHDHHHDHSHEHDHHHHDHHNHGHQADHGDLNLKAAYLHVLADAATSVLAIVALVSGMVWGWSWLDPLMGVVGAVLVAIWAKGLVKETGRVLLDCEMDHPVVEEVRAAIVNEPGWGSVEIVDLHVWRIGRKHYAGIISLVTHSQTPNPDEVRRLLSVHQELAHLSIEINHCAAD